MDTVEINKGDILIIKTYNPESCLHQLNKLIERKRLYPDGNVFLFISPDDDLEGVIRSGSEEITFKVEKKE